MEILILEECAKTRPLYAFLAEVSDPLRQRIFAKLHSYVEHGDVYHCKSLKSLNSRIWKYKGTIYKLRVDNGKESARVLFAKSKDGDLTIIHAFLKSTRKTPAKDARQAIGLYAVMDEIKSIKWALDQ